MIDELDASSDPLVPCLVLFHMLLYLTGKHAIALFKANGSGLHDKRFRNLSCCVIGDLDDRTVIDGRMSKKMSL